MLQLIGDIVASALYPGLTPRKVKGLTPTLSWVGTLVPLRRASGPASALRFPLDAGGRSNGDAANTGVAAC